MNNKVSNSVLLTLDFSPMKIQEAELMGGWRRGLLAFMLYYAVVLNAKNVCCTPLHS